VIDVREAAALLTVKPATLYQWAYQRRIPVVKLNGRALRFRLTELDRAGRATGAAVASGSGVVHVLPCEWWKAPSARGRLAV